MSVDLSITYLGLKLKNPLVASTSPMTSKLETLQRLEEAGASAAVWPSALVADQPLLRGSPAVDLR